MSQQKEIGSMRKKERKKWNSSDAKGGKTKKDVAKSKHSMIGISPSILNTQSKSEWLNGNSDQTELKKNTLLRRDKEEHWK